MKSERKAERRSELDLMGMLVILGLVFFHTAQIFTGGDFYVMHEPSSILALVLVAFASLWGMPLMFLIAGMAIWFSLGRRTTKQFVVERTRRLLIPFIVSLPLLVPPQVYYKLKGVPTYNESYAQFLPRFFDVRFDPTGFPLFLKGAPPDEFFRISTLYFLIDLYIFTLLLLPIFIYLRSPAGRRIVERFALFSSRPGVIFLLALPIAVSEAAFGSDHPGAWNPLSWVPFIFYGFLFAGERQLGTTLEKRWKSALILGFLAFIGWFAGLGVLYEVFDVDPFSDYGALSVLMRFLRGFTGWFWVIALMGLVNRSSRSDPQKDSGAAEAERTSKPDSLDHSHKPTFIDRVARYARDARLPFYILHQTLIVLIGFYVVKWQVSGLVKYFVICLTTIAITLLVYDIGIRRTKLTRFLFGVKER